MLLKHDRLKKKKSIYRYDTSNSVMRPVNVQLIFSFWKKKKKNQQSENSSLFRSSIQGPSRLDNEGKQMPLPFT